MKENSKLFLIATFYQAKSSFREMNGRENASACYVGTGYDSSFIVWKFDAIPIKQKYQEIEQNFTTSKFPLRIPGTFMHPSMMKILGNPCASSGHHSRQLISFLTKAESATCHEIQIRASEILRPRSEISYLQSHRISQLLIP